MNREARLQSAASFVPGYSGKNVVRGYARWFGVDLGCALKELTMLGVALDPLLVTRMQLAIAAQLRLAQQRAERRRAVLAEAAAAAEAAEAAEACDASTFVLLDAWLERMLADEFGRLLEDEWR